MTWNGHKLIDYSYTAVNPSPADGDVFTSATRHYLVKFCNDIKHSRTKQFINARQQFEIVI